ncbi:MAG: hypothetical protein K9K65_16910 [Desulfarculaceae bacterium]|nr:hypothetical protein [Desulfarculaceae bacterium]MCF8099522.1 hypothetical protein [Desulfarculaceae bacterium]MCF8121990.1 hypothetical protein [Desulfarculaceae bacterium]
MNFLEYLGTEEQNMLTSLINFKADFDLFYELDGIYQAPISSFLGTEGEELVPTLYLFVHFHLYFTTSCLLRSHLSEALVSLRKAIDAGLTAYAILLDPGKAEAYVNRDKFFLHIKANVQTAITKDAAAYPLAQNLIQIHDMCSQYGSHSDVDSFLHRLETKGEDSSDRYELFLHYFQFPKGGSEEYRFYFLSVLQAFLLIFLIFKIFFSQKLRIIDPVWEQRIAKLGTYLDRERQQAYEKFTKSTDD